MFYFCIGQYLTKSRLLLQKLALEKENLPFGDEIYIAKRCELECYITLLIKYIDLVDRRILKEETIAHKEKMMSVFETYTPLNKKLS